jgi:enoyl-CoA hydratase
MTHLRKEQHDGIAVIRIERPPVNAMSPELLDEGLAVLAALEGDPPDAVVLTGLPGSFSAGLDLKVAPTLDAARANTFREAIELTFRGWYGFPRPVVAAVSGHAIAGGLILALCADWRIVGSAGRFGLTEIKAGVPYPGTARAIVQAELAAPDARRLMLRADLVDAAEACRIGLFDQQVPDDDLLERALAVAREMAALPAAAFAATKAAMRAPVLDVPIEAPDEWMSATTPDAAAALLASRERRAE